MVKKSTRKKNMYFDNDAVEKLLDKYVEGGCVNVSLRDEIMSHAEELIRQIIRAHNFEYIFPGRDGSSFNELFQVAWCVKPDSLVITENGIIPISNILNGNKLVYGKDSLEPFSGFVKIDNIDTKAITTKFGYNLEASLDHPLLVLRGAEEYKLRVKDIKVGDLLKVQYDQQVFGNNNKINFTPQTVGGATTLWNPPDVWNEELAYIIGLIVSEGSWEDYRVTIYNNSEEIKNVCLNNSQGLRFKHVCCKGNRFTFGSKRFAEFVKWLGLNKKCNEKRIPKQILASSKNIIVSFLQGMFDGDGHSNKRNGIVGYTSTSLKLIEELKVLLANLGMLTKTSKLKRTSTMMSNPKGGYRKSDVKPSYQLLLSSIDSAKFYECIGFKINSKQSKKRNLTKMPFRQVYVNLTDILKGKHKLINDNGLSYHRLVNKKTAPFEATCNKLAVFIPEIRNLVGSKFIWLPVVKIEDGKSDVVDIEVPGSGMFNVNCINSFNCQIEKTLYKYDPKPGSPKVFNLFSQVAKTRILAYLKKEKRDKKNMPSYKDYLQRRHKTKSKSIEDFEAFISELENFVDYDDDFLELVAALKELWLNDDKPYDGLKTKLKNKTGKNQSVVTQFLRIIRYHRDEFSVNQHDIREFDDKEDNYFFTDQDA